MWNLSTQKTDWEWNWNTENSMWNCIPIPEYEVDFPLWFFVTFPSILRENVTQTATTNNGTFSGVTGVEGSECHSGRGFILGTLKGHTLGATTQGLLWKQDLKSQLKILQRGEYVKIKISHVKLHKKIGVFHFGAKNKKHHHHPTNLKKIILLHLQVP